jgi:hypothetical protein
MKLVNFVLGEAFESVQVISAGVTWDLHNSADFEGLEFYPADSCLALHWVVVQAPEPGSGQNASKEPAAARGSELHLLFRHVRFLRMQVPEHETVSPSNERTVHGISYVRPGDILPNLRAAEGGAEAFNLYFEFISGRTLEIGAESVEFVKGPLQSD